MAQERETELRIKELLRKNRKGLTVAEIVTGVGISRSPVMKYLKVLEARGEVENLTFGNTRVFFPARRIPASALLNLSSDLVCMVDESLTLLSANRSFREFFGLEEAMVKGRLLAELEGQKSGIAPGLLTGLCGGEEVTGDLTIRQEGRESKDEVSYLRARGIPTLFEDGTQGTTLLLEDLTAEREYVHNLEFLARTSAELADMPDDADIYQYIVEQVWKLVPASVVSIGSLDSGKQTLTIRGVAADPVDIERCKAVMGRELVGLSFSYGHEPLAAEMLSRREIAQAPSIYSMLLNDVPAEVADQLGSGISFGTGYGMGCNCRGGTFGNVAILVKKGHSIRHKEVIEAFLAQAAVALQRRHMREKIQAAEKRLKVHESPGGQA
jgi:PAS domain-containing protein